MNKFFVFLVICCMAAAPSSKLFAEQEFSLQLSPAAVVPIGLEQFNTGFGAAFSLDWAFWSFAERFNLGVNAGGAFTSLPVQVGDPLMLVEGRAGPFVRWRPLDRWAFSLGLGGGVYHHSRGEDNDTTGFGDVSLDAAFLISPAIAVYAETGFSFRAYASRPLNTLDIALGIRLNLTEIMSSRARVKIDKAQQYRVFPVSWAWYENNPVATVKVTNEEPNEITDISLSFFMDSYMSQPWTFATLPRLAPGESAEIPVTALFNEAMMNLTETVTANGTIRMVYRSLGARKEIASPLQMPIFHRNTLSWDDDRRAAAFVSPRDSAARLFARYVAGAVESQPPHRTIPANVTYAIALFEALRLYGISYVVVPATSFARVASDESVLDNVSYPYQALYYRGGDCSYLSILFCSMLESLEIKSAFITIPGHIYVAFDVGDANWLRGNNRIIEMEGTRWLPLELTVPSEGFARGWTIGSTQWLSSGPAAALYPIRDAWQVYPSVTVPSSGDHPPEMPEWDAILRATRSEQDKLIR